jgi:gluconate kinase
MKLDIQKWNTARKEIEAEIKALKQEVRQPYREITGREAAHLLDLKATATELYCLRAATRNKKHLPYREVESGLALLSEYARQEAA